jgi:dTDP-4-dehydrorhamnose 3,5-epimerase
LKRVKSIGPLFPEVLVIETEAFEDDRGWFLESYNRKEYEDMGVSCAFVQDNHSFSTEKGTLRGLHFQNHPQAQSKLVRCVRGSIKDVVVDIRRGSPNLGRWATTELSSRNMTQVFVPKGFAHGFLTLEDDTEVEYKADAYYDRTSDRSIRWDDPDIGIPWGISSPILSQKDASAPMLKDADCNLRYVEGRK